MSYLMEFASEHNSAWPGHWPTGIWDVRKRNILQRLRLPEDFELAVTAQVATFLSIWQTLEEESQRALYEGA